MDIVSDPTTLQLDSSIVHCMACCHSLIHLNGELTGNPLDVKLFEAIEWDMKEQFNVGVNPDYGVPTPTLVFSTIFNHIRAVPLQDIGPTRGFLKFLLYRSPILGGCLTPRARRPWI